MRAVMRFELLAKLGYAARGIVFLLVAVLALFSGIAGGQPETKTAISTLLQQPLGRVWVGLIGFGLLGFVAWRLAQSIADADGQGNDGKAMVIRTALLASAVTYTGLAVYALGRAFSASGDSGGSGEKGLAQWVMSQPSGSYVAIAIGIGLIVGGIVTGAKGALRKFEKYVQFPDRSGVLSYICMYGLMARGAVFSVTGILFAYAGFKVDPDQAGGIADALEWLRELPFGSVLYVVIAIGLAAFGVYNLIAAKYRTVKGPRLDDVTRAVPLNLRH
ncbi:DUF1206 domain-containing protein [Aliirhizobium cellulosilyticum]|uniref:DUF1206 domain-containing protein n=1 Tax=Aliirhizobium cellulosilyticum TaxID=393664 RepID=A0A7W6SDN6_9HYPH|nr:DUF1206 domain-containing protein [Rhizobium cellulosilyticum]MBB4351836.1 hypothetical protein [Rhizobium cellulosilyticum]MBB4415072.1 hypothetical protein [Rhizobium cellulosilyticum]MBB4449764.1 hypothetical protein [Rhizobium cellulosilyticum]